MRNFRLNILYSKSMGLTKSKNNQKVGLDDDDDDDRAGIICWMHYQRVQWECIFNDYVS